MKKITILLLLAVVISCKKEPEPAPEPEPTPPVAAITQTTSSQSTVYNWCIYDEPGNGAKLLRCVTGTFDEMSKIVLNYRDNGYSGVTAIKRTSCSAC